MYSFLVLLHILISIMLIVVILLQSGKGGGMAATFGGSGTGFDSLFGAGGGAGFLSKVTMGLAVAFMLMCIVFSFVVRPDTNMQSVMEQQAKQGGTAPAGAPMPITNEAPQQLPGAEVPAAPAPAAPAGK